MRWPFLPAVLQKQHRLLLPSEFLRLQGIVYDTDVDIRILAGDFGDNLVADLAGNAFETQCCLASMLTLWVCVALSTPPPPLERSPSCPAEHLGAASGAGCAFDAFWGDTDSEDDGVSTTV